LDFFFEVTTRDTYCWQINDAVLNEWLLNPRTVRHHYFQCQGARKLYAMYSVLQIKIIRFLFFYAFLFHSYMWYLD